MLGLALNEAAYMAEIVRAGIQSVDEGQTEAAHGAGHVAAADDAPDRAAAGDAGDHPADRQRDHRMLKTTSLVVAVPLLPSCTSSCRRHRRRDLPADPAAARGRRSGTSLLTSVLMVGQYYLERHYARGSPRS